VLGRTELWERRRVADAPTPALAIGGTFLDGLLIGIQVAQSAPDA